MAYDHPRITMWIRRGESLGLTFRKMASELGSARRHLARIGHSINEFFHHLQLRA